MKPVIRLKSGWTKEEILRVIKEKNNNTVCMNKDKCAYRNSEGNACAIGAFLPDDLAIRIDKDYSEGVDITELLRSDLYSEKVLYYMPTKEVYFLRQLQAVHDNTKDDSSVYSNIENFLNHFEYEVEK